MTHPYWPTNAHLPGYVPMEADFMLILGGVGTAALAVFAAIWIIAGKARLSTWERCMTGWLMVSGLIHIIIEGYVVTQPDFWKDSSRAFLSEVWKEYSHADSRYATRDTFVIAMEAVTAAFDGPACLLAVWGLLRRRPWRYSVIIIVSVCQIYGDVLYYATCFMEGFKHSRPEMQYFWVYFVIVNAIWIVVPLFCIRHSLARISAALARAEGKQKRK